MSQVSKLNQVNSKLGATMPGQQTTRYIYDSVSSAAGQRFYEFFTNFNGKTEFQTNLTTNKLDSSESMVIKSIFVSCTDFIQGNRINKLNIYVGNQCVIKDLPLAFNAGNKGTSYARISSAANEVRQLEIRLLTDIVIPPQTTFKATLETSSDPTQVGDNVTLGLRGYGVIFSAGSTF